MLFSDALTLFFLYSPGSNPANSIVFLPYFSWVVKPTPPPSDFDISLRYCWSSTKFVSLLICELNYRILLESHKQALVEKLKETEDPPLVLHLASLILFQTVSQSMLNASGRFVSNILQWLEKRLPGEGFETLRHYQS